MKLKLLITLCCLIVATSAVNWNGNDWALNCDFSGNDLSHVRVPGSQCGGRCSSTPGCTHFTWTHYDGGTCWMKQGPVCKSSATDKQNAVCGVTHEECSGPNPISKPETGTGTGTGTGHSSGALAKLTNCQMGYGTNYENDGKDYSAYNYITIWINTVKDGCSNNPTCTDFNNYYQGNMLRKAKSLGKIPVFYAYIIAFEARNLWGLKDCNVGNPNLCQKGTDFIRDQRARIIERYDHHSKHFADILGRDSFSVFLMEPDFYQFYSDKRQQGGNLSGSYLRSLFDDICKAIKKNLPNAAISWDISAWASESEMRTWWGYFKDSPYIDFINTSGGEANGGSEKLKPDTGEPIKWSFMHQLTGKKIIADCGYGVAGNGLNNREPWYQSWNVDARINDGVCSVTISGATRNPTYKKNVC